MEIDLKKVIYLGIAIVLAGLVYTNLAQPTYTKVESGKTQIESLSWTGK